MTGNDRHNDNDNEIEPTVTSDTAGNGAPNETDASQDTAAAKGTRAGFVALIGAPNAGKSTLLNRLVGAKLSIVTHKVQTTRAIMRGVAIHGTAQIVFVDTPGIFAPKRRLDRAMVDTAWSGAEGADIVALLIDARKGIDDEIAPILKRLADLKRRKVLILNKIDVTKREELLALAQRANAEVPFDRTFMISALDGDGAEDLMDYFAEHLPASPWLYPEDQISDLPLRMIAAEITREKLFLRLHQEIPYASTVETTQWKQLKDGSARVEQTIYVERESQKKIVLGKAGQTIKAISQSARQDIAAMVEHPIHLFLFVKVRENWGNDPERYREMGLEFPR
ncbi:GTPase Era [Breoghania sp. JC706]|uniref:GTPase Era n=1 Tax=Breoghania sp. JC706 TaxID=3117732 RepID=UPI00300B85A1